jgi:hypothetical protein
MNLSPSSRQLSRCALGIGWRQIKSGKVMDDGRSNRKSRREEVREWDEGF